VTCINNGVEPPLELNGEASKALREEGETLGGTSPRMGKNDSETLNLRELNNGGDRT
jgi:hypothetical protein